MLIGWDRGHFFLCDKQVIASALGQLRVNFICNFVKPLKKQVKLILNCPPAQVIIYTKVVHEESNKYRQDYPPTKATESAGGPAGVYLTSLLLLGEARCKKSQLNVGNSACNKMYASRHMKNFTKTGQRLFQDCAESRSWAQIVSAVK